MQSLSSPGMIPRNGFGFQNCIFRGCRFYLVTFMAPEPEYENFRPPAHAGLNWITERPDQPPLPMTIEGGQSIYLGLRSGFGKVVGVPRAFGVLVFHSSRPRRGTNTPAPINATRQAALPKAASRMA